MCRKVGLKTNDAGVYDLKPFTISQVYFEGGRAEEKEEMVGSGTSINSGYTLNRTACREITHIINSFIFNKDQSTPNYSPE